MHSKLHTQKALLVSACAAGALLMGGCSSSDKSKTPSTPSSTNLYTINASGGIGGSDGGNGGFGDYFQVEKYNIGDIIISNKLDLLENEKDDVLEGESYSVVDTSVFTPRDLTGLGDTGDVAMTVTADTTLTVLTTGDPAPAAGTYYQVLLNNSIYLSDGTGTVPGTHEQVTGIEIASGATLTLGLNRTTYTQVNLQNDLVNHGVLTKAAQSPTSMGDLNVYPASYIATGDINNNGTADAQDGGQVWVDANYSVFNQGNINTSGADTATAATNAGDGGWAGFGGNIVENAGNIDASGGSATDGFGGDSNGFGIYTDWGNAYSSGTIDTYGGNGSAGGGSAGYAEIYSENTGDSGDLKLNGTINAYGGDSTGGFAGSGDYVYLYAEGADISSSATINIYGGDTTDPASNGGDGGYFEIYSEYDSFYNASDSSSSGDVRVMGNIDTSGGDAVATGTGSGGDGDYVYVYVYTNDQPEIESTVKFMGYESIDVSGGDANYGGDANDVQFYLYDSWSETDVNVAGGSIYNEANIDATGGNVVATDPLVSADAGRGGDLYFETPYYFGAILPDSMMVMNSGDIDTSAGSGSINNTSTTTSRSGYLYFWGYNGVENSGTITNNGGSDVAADGGTAGYGGYSDSVEMYSDRGPINNSAAITANGGDGEYQGGYASSIYMYGASVNNTGNLSANGGNATVTLAGSDGGTGGWIELHSPNASKSTSSGTVSYAGGAGETAGDEGAFVVGGLCTGEDC